MLDNAKASMTLVKRYMFAVGEWYDFIVSLKNIPIYTTKIEFRIIKKLPIICSELFWLSNKFLPIP